MYPSKLWFSVKLEFSVVLNTVNLTRYVSYRNRTWRYELIKLILDVFGKTEMLLQATIRKKDAQLEIGLNLPYRAAYLQKVLIEIVRNIFILTL